MTGSQKVKRLTPEIEQSAYRLGEALRSSREVQAYRQVSQEVAADHQAGQWSAELESTYARLLQRQAAGEIIPLYEIEAFYRLEHQASAHPLLLKQSRALESLKDLFTETHALLSDELEINLREIIG